MRVKRAFLVFLIGLVVFSSWPIFKANACGHDGFYVGLGYNQLFMYTPQNRFGGGGNVHFSPGYGANLTLGYDFCNSRWGIQMPVEYARIKLNRLEWINDIGSTLEAVLHLIEGKNGIDFHLVMGVGWSYLSEGDSKNNSAAGGITADVGPGLSYYFHRSDKSSAALAVELPLRMVHYFGTHLSNNGTTLFAIPLRVSIQVGF